MRIAKGLAVVVILLFAAASANAAGFRLPEAGAKAMGMGFAFAAQADDPSAIYFNPAGITQLEGQNVMAGVTYIRENGGEFTGITPLTGGATRTETQKDLTFFVPNAYWTRKASPNFAYGVGIFTPFGLGTEFDNWNTQIFRNQIDKIKLLTVVVNPTVAWKFGDALSVGAGIDFMYGSAELVKNSLAAGGFKFKLKGDGTAWGYNFGILLTPAKTTRIGFNYRSPFDLYIKDGDVTLYDNVVALPPAVLPLNSKAHTHVRMPATAALGVAQTFFDRLTVEADLDWTFWSSFRELDIQNANSAALSSTPTGKRRNWRDVTAIRVGAQFKVTDPLALRAGFAYDPTPVPAEELTPDLPDANRLNYMVGAGYKYSNWTFDGSYFYLQKKDRNVSNIRTEENGNPIGANGTWKGSAHLVAFDVGYKF